MSVHLEVSLANTEAENTEAGGLSRLKPHQSALVYRHLPTIFGNRHLPQNWLQSQTNINVNLRNTSGL